MALARGCPSRAALSTTGLFALSTRSFKSSAHAKLITHWTSPESKQYFDRISSVLANRYSIGAGLTDPAPISWGLWEQQIEDKAFVAKLKKDYEAMSFNLYSGKPNPSEAEEWAQLEQLAEKRVAFLNECLITLNNKLAQAMYDRECVAHFTTFHFYDRLPGLEEEHKNEHIHELYFACEEDQIVDKVDVGPYIRQLKDGHDPHIKEMDGITTVGTVDFSLVRNEFIKKYEETGGNLLQKAAKIIEGQVAGNNAVMAVQVEKAKEAAAKASVEAITFKNIQSSKFRYEAEAVISMEQLTLASRRDNMPSSAVAGYLSDAIRVIFAAATAPSAASSLRELAKKVLAKQSWKSGSPAEKAAESAAASILSKSTGSAEEVAKASAELEKLTSK
eukprot:gb/GEZN01009229.1/.p1 GENE.gb/GEZN01009229.1/~~gb/GEZN01009229.1/.p1  ORF type:complete len:390 (+),score=77.03 gb/GEZN01009229.1/:41-1210(+)